MTEKKESLRLLLACILLVFFFATPVGAAAAATQTPATKPFQVPSQRTEPTGIGIRLVDIPSATQNDPRARSYIVDHVNPGTTIERRIEVQNNTESAQSVRLYASAADIEAGVFTFEDGVKKNELTTWTSVSNGRLNMAPGEHKKVLVTIDVPSDAPESEQYGVIWAEISNPPSDDGGITHVSRAGVRVYLSVGPGNGPPTDFSIDSITASRDKAGNPQISAKVTNTGGRAIDLVGTLQLENGPGGVSAGPFPVTQGTTIAPQATAPVTVVLDPQLPNGPWEATLELRSGLVTNQATAKISFPEAGKAEPVQTEQPFNPLWIVIPAALILLTVTGLIIARQRSRSLGITTVR